MNSWVLTIDTATGVERSDHEIDSEQGLTQRLQDVVRRREGSAMLKPPGPTGEFLLVGVEGDSAFAHFDPQEGGGPYLWARSSPPAPDEEFVEFNLGGTATEVPRHRCIPVAEMLSIAKHYYKTAKLPKTSDWEEDEG